MKTIQLRLPDELHPLLKAHAEADGRSLNNLILTLIRDYLAARPAAKAAAGYWEANPPPGWQRMPTAETYPRR